MFCVNCQEPCTEKESSALGMTSVCTRPLTQDPGHSNTSGHCQVDKEEKCYNKQNHIQSKYLKRM